MVANFVSLFLLVFTALVIGQEAPQDSSGLTDEKALEEKLAAEMNGDDSSQVKSPKPVRTGSKLNPNISVIGSFIAAGTRGRAVEKNFDLGLSESEFSFNAYVDPYVKADFFIAFANESEDPFSGPDPDAAADGEYEAELEEAYLTTLSLPFALQLKAGKFRSRFGKINQTHPHALGFVDLPRMYVNFFGDEGLADKGISLSWLVPNPLGFYEELTVEMTSGALDGPSFEAGGDDLLYVGHLKNFFDLTENSTLEVGFSGAYGRNSTDNHSTILGADATVRWKPLQFNRFRSFEWMTEVLLSRRKNPETVSSTAFYTYLNYQFSRRWFLGGRIDFSEIPDDAKYNEKAFSAILGFYATEFQKLELQYQYGDPDGLPDFHRLLLRAVFVIGAHGAHQY